MQVVMRSVSFRVTSKFLASSVARLTILETQGARCSIEQSAPRLARKCNPTDLPVPEQALFLVFGPQYLSSARSHAPARAQGWRRLDKSAQATCACTQGINALMQQAGILHTNLIGTCQWGKMRNTQMEHVPLRTGPVATRATALQDGPNR